MKNRMGIYLLFVCSFLGNGYSCLGVSKPPTAPKVKPQVKGNVIAIQPVLNEPQALCDLTFEKPITVRKQNASEEVREVEFVRLLKDETYVFTAEVINKGQAPSAACRMIYKIFTKEPGDQNFSELQGRVFHFDVPPLFPGTKAEVPLIFKPENVGLFYLYAKVDSKEQVKESNEANNLTVLGQQLAFQVQKPYVDLALNAWVGDPKTFKHLSTVESVKIHFSVTNEGTIPLYGGEVQVIFHHSRAGTKTVSFRNLEPGQVFSNSVAHRFRGSGKKKVTVKVIAAGGVQESSGANNAEKLEFRVH